MASAVSPHFLEQLHHAVAPLRRLADTMNQHGLTDDLAYPLTRVQAGIGILKYDLHASTLRPHLGTPERGDFGSVKAYQSRRGLDQPQYRPTNGRLPRTRLADQSQDFTSIDVEGHVVDSLHPTGRTTQHPSQHGEIHGKSTYLQ